MQGGAIGRTFVHGSDPNDFVWSLSKTHADQFERAIYHLIRLRLSTSDGAVQVHPTPRTGDQGRDIEIRFRQPIMIGTRKVVPPAGEAGHVYVECKITMGDRLADSFLSDASQHESGRFQAYILVTNGTITPYAHYRAQIQWERLQADFILIDRSRLRSWLFSQGQPFALAHDLEPPQCGDEIAEDVVVSSQTRTDTTAGEHTTQTYFTIRNYSNSPQHVALSLASDLSWASDVNLEAILEPGEDRAYRLDARQQLYGIDADLAFAVRKHDRSHHILVSSAEAKIFLEPPFMGKGHRQLRDDLTCKLEKASGFQVISIQGDAGVGKTRTIQEALDPLAGGLIQVFSTTCDSRSGEFDFSQMGNRLRDITEQIGEFSDPSDLRGAVRLASRSPFPVVLILEDLHHCTSDSIRVIKELILSPPDLSPACSLVITGRDDYTFPNVDYFALLDLIRHEESRHATGLRLEPFSDHDARFLINAVAVDLPQPAIDRIRALGQNNPFIIIECLQYLLDSGLAQLISRRTIGVPNPERFKGLSGLPVNVEALYRLRIEALLAAPGGEAAVDLLCLGAFLSLTMDGAFIGEFFASDSGYPTLSLLRQRRFIDPNYTSASIHFAHENLFHFVKRWLDATSDSAAIANRLRKNGAFHRLSQFARGDLLTIAGCYPEAMAEFDRIWTRIASITNFSSEEIDRSFFPHFDFLFRASGQLNLDQLVRSNIALATAYMGVHNFPLVQGEMACSSAYKKLIEVYPSAKAGTSYKLAVRQMQAHALQNIGRATESLKIMLELQAEIKLLDTVAPTVEYDLYDRLQEHYRKSNHLTLVNSYGKLARRAVERSGDERLHSSHLITQSLVCLYRGAHCSSDAARRAREVAESVGVHRFVVFNHLTENISAALYCNGDKRALGDVYKEGKELLRKATLESFSDSIIRLELLLGTLALQVVDDPAEAHSVARTYIAAGRDAAVRFGVGLYGWALDNLELAILSSDDGIQQEMIRRSVSAMIDNLRRRGLLFVGACDGTYPNVHAIANAVRFYASFSEDQAAGLIIRGVSAYNTEFGNDVERTLPLVSAARAGRAIFWPPRGIDMLRYPQEGGYFTPLF
jgi:hypothetical protein